MVWDRSTRGTLTGVRTDASVGRQNDVGCDREQAYEAIVDGPGLPRRARTWFRGPSLVSIIWLFPVGWTGKRTQYGLNPTPSHTASYPRIMGGAPTVILLFKPSNASWRPFKWAATNVHG